MEFTTGDFRGWHGVLWSVPQLPCGRRVRTRIYKLPAHYDPERLYLN